MLRKMAQPLGFGPEELMVMAGYMSEKPPQAEATVETSKGHLDPFVVLILAAGLCRQSDLLMPAAPKRSPFGWAES
jgi:hypothetical protein